MRSRSACCSPSSIRRTSVVFATQFARSLAAGRLFSFQRRPAGVPRVRAISTTAADAYLRPTLAAYLEILGERVEGSGAARPGHDAVLGRRNCVGTSCGADAAGCVSLGPAAGVVAAAYVGRRAATATSSPSIWGVRAPTSPSILAGEAQTTTALGCRRVPIKHPTVDVHTVSAGGGSIAWVDAGGALRVGPRLGWRAARSGRVTAWAATS